MTQIADGTSRGAAGWAPAAVGTVAVTDSDRIPFAVPDLGEAEIAAVADALRSGWITSGPQMAAFEQDFVNFTAAPVHAVATNSATAGLHLALEALGIGPGDEVLVPTWTFTATAEVVGYLGATPVLVDVDPTTLNLDLAKVAAAIGPRTKAVLPVHMAGLSVDMERLAALCAPQGIRIVEDAAHALPASTRGELVGSCRWSDATVFSFYANKTITTGEGGMVTTRSSEIAERIRVMRLHGIDRDVFNRYRSDRPAWAYDVVAPGFKYNMPDTAAAMGRVQLGRVRELRDKRAAIAARYVRELANLPLDLPASPRDGDLHAWHLFIIRLRPDAPVTRDAFIQEMSDRGISCSVHFIPLHQHTYWRESLDLTDEMFPAAAAVFPTVVSLPLFSSMSETQVDRVVAAIHEILA